MDDAASDLKVSKATLCQSFRINQELFHDCHVDPMQHGEAAFALAAGHAGLGLEEPVVYLRRYMQCAYGEPALLASPVISRYRRTFIR